MINRRGLMAGAAGLGVVGVAGCATSATGTARQPSWRSVAAMPLAIQEIYAAEWDGRILTAGGLDGRPDGLFISDRSFLYDPGANVWAETARLPAPRHHPMIVSVGGAVFALGGYGRSEAGEWTSMTECWALEGDGWREVTRLRAPQAETVGLGHDGRIHLIGGRAPKGAANGGWNDQGDIATHRVFEVASGQWSERAPLPLARNSAAGVVHDGAMWVAGGRTVEGGGTGRLDRYDPVRDTWEARAPIPPSSTGRQVGGGLALGVLGDGRLAAFGGEWFGPRGSGGGGVFSETWLYDVGADGWSAGPSMTTPRHGLAAASIQGAVFALAGGRTVGGGDAGPELEALVL